MGKKNTSVIHPQTVLNDCVEFRRLMGMKSSDLEELQELFGNLVMASIMAQSTRVHPEATQELMDRMQRVVDVLVYEWPIRYSLMITKPLRDLIGKPT